MDGHWTPPDVMLWRADIYIHMWIYVWWTWCNLQAGKSATSASEISVLHGTTQHDTIYVYDNKGMRWHADGRLTWSVVIERQCPLNVQPISIPVAIGCNKTCQNMILIYFIFRFGTPNPNPSIIFCLVSIQPPPPAAGIAEDNRNKPSFSIYRSMASPGWLCVFSFFHCWRMNGGVIEGNILYSISVVVLTLYPNPMTNSQLFCSGGF